MRTHTTLAETYGVEVPSHLEAEAEVPLLTGMQRQGDVIVVPIHTDQVGDLVPAGGVPVVRGEAGGNTHLLVAACDVRWAPVVDVLMLGVLTVADGAEAYLAHPEHGYMGIGPGCYRVSRQREQADEIRTVAD